MSAPTWLQDLLFYKKLNAKKVADITGCPAVPNIADVDNPTSVRMSHSIFSQWGIVRGRDGSVVGEKGSKPGAAFERAVRSYLDRELNRGKAERYWRVGTENIKVFEQYEHLGRLQTLLDKDETLRVTLGTDYQIEPDVTIAAQDEVGCFLHAVVSCKWTLRSDRAQNVRQEFKVLVNSRRGRTPHLVAITMEPLPSRLLSLTRGTGEVDAVYHLAFDEMVHAVNESSTPKGQKAAWAEMTSQQRLRNYNELVRDLTRRLSETLPHFEFVSRLWCRTLSICTVSVTGFSCVEGVVVYGVY